MLHHFHGGVDVPPPIPGIAPTPSIPLPPTLSEDPPDITEPPRPGGLPPVEEPALPEPALRMLLH